MKLASKTFVIPAKTGPGSSLADLLPPDVAAQCRSDAKLDAFARYSDDAVRLRTLLMREGDGAEGAAAPASASANSAGGKDAPRRRTRISFEVHPDLLLMDLLYPDD